MNLKKSNWLWGAILFIAGLFMIICPLGCAKIVVMLMGVASIALGVYNIIFTNKTFDDEKYKKMVLIKSCVGIVFGTLAVIFAMPFAKAAMNVGFYIFAVYLIIGAAFGFYTVSLLKDTNVDRKRYIFENLALLISAILIFLITPETLGKVIIIILGIVALAAGIVLLAIEIVSLVKSKKNTVEVADSDVTVVDEPAKDAAETETAENTSDSAEEKKE